MHKSIVVHCDGDRQPACRPAAGHHAGPVGSAASGIGRARSMTIAAAVRPAH